MPGCSVQLAPDGHRLTTFRLVAVALVLASTVGFFGLLRRRGCGCLEVAEGVDVDQARRLSLAIYGSRVEPESCPLSARCVRPAHLEVRS